MKTQHGNSPQSANLLEALEQRIAALEEQVKALAPLAHVAKAAMEPPDTIKEAHAILSAVPEATLKALGVVQVGFDPHMIWFKMLRGDGKTISVKKDKADFRIRVRDQAGALLKEVNPPCN